MPSLRFLVHATSLLALFLSQMSVAEDAPGLQTALTSGDVGVTLRARYEHVSQDGVADNADALTARLRLNYRTGQWNRLAGFVEYDYVFHALTDFNSGGGTSPGKLNFPTVADPKGVDLNQLYLDYSANEDFSVRIGRQRILLDNQRFVGGVGWRQNEQTYDALTLTSDAVANTKLSYSYVGNVRRIFGDDVAAGRNSVNTHLLNAKVSVSDGWSVSPYYYRIDNDDVAAFSTATAGVRVVGSFRVDDNKVGLVAEFATQSDIANNSVNYDANYAHLSAAWEFPSSLSVGIAYELLEGGTSPGMMFRTPLATLHAFQGWADQFLTTPQSGIEDVFATVKFKTGRWSLTGIYHDFSSDVGSTRYGSEVDVSAATKLSDNLSILFKGAFFSGDTPTMEDTSKFWIQFSANY